MEDTAGLDVVAEADDDMKAVGKFPKISLCLENEAARLTVRNG